MTRDLQAMADDLSRRYEDSKTPAQKLRDRLDYAVMLRRKADSYKRLYETLNRRMQKNGHGDVTIKWRPLRRAWHVVFGPHNIVLSEEQIGGLFSFLFELEKGVRAHADAIEKEIAGE